MRKSETFWALLYLLNAEYVPTFGTAESVLYRLPFRALDWGEGKGGKSQAITICDISIIQRVHIVNPMSSLAEFKLNEAKLSI